MTEPTAYLIGLGSNIAPELNFPRLIRHLVSAFAPLDLSRIYDTAPLGLATSNRFLNAVAYMESTQTPEIVKARFNEIETALGRDRSRQDRAVRDRVADLDILAVMPGAIRDAAAIALPEEPYYRLPALELLASAGFVGAPVAIPTTGAVALPLLEGGIGPKADMIGQQPLRLTRDEAGGIRVQRQFKAALVTGGGVRLGRAIALSLAEQGYDIALHYHHSADEALKVARMIRETGRMCEVFQHDLADIAGIDALMAAVTAKFPHLALLVNNASVYEGGKIAETTPEMLDWQWTINFKAPLFLIKAFCARIERGDIINMLDNKIAFNQFHYAAYLTSKKALFELTKMAALEFAPRIRINGIAPGVVLPPVQRSQQYINWRAETIPLARIGLVEEICNAVLNLIENKFLNGHVLVVDGGESINFVGRNAVAFTGS